MRAARAAVQSVMLYQAAHLPAFASPDVLPFYDAMAI